MIIFENDGEIDPLSISIMGISVKESENPIGFFGTGLKYAIAVLLRTGHVVEIFSGETPITFDLSPIKVRGKDFDIVRMKVGDGEMERTSFTTEYGKGWGVWMAYREIACNGKDEHGTSRRSTERPAPEAGRTKIIVHGDDFEAVFAESNRFLLDDEPQHTVGNVEIRDRPGKDLFYRGVRVMQFKKPALYTYNCLTKLTLTEDRTVKDQWYPIYYITNALMECEDEDILRKVLTASDDTLEGCLNFGEYGTPGEAFLRVTAACAADRMCKTNLTAVKVLQDHARQQVAPREIEMTAVQQESMARALDFCARIGFPIRDAYPIKVVESLGSGTLGLAAQQTIFVSERVFQIGGAKQLASTLIEEYLHLRHGWPDLSREMQTFLFEKLVSVGEELVGEPL